jgi:hypothetical protein
MAQDTTYTTMGIVEETVYGETPASALQLVNLTNFPGMKRVRNSSRPDVLTGDRRRFANVELQLDGTLSLQSILQYGNLTALHEGLMASDVDTPVNITGTTMSAVGTTGVCTDGSAGLGTIQDGDMLYITGTDSGANDGWKGPVTSAAAGVFTVPASQIVDETGPTDWTIKTTRHLDGNAPKSFSCEWHATQLTNKFRAALGQRVSGATWSWQAGQFVEESFELAGLAPDLGAATIGTGGPTAAATTQFLGPVSDFGKIYVSGVETTFIISSLNLSVQNVLSPLYGLGSAGPSETSTGPMDITLSASVAYDDNSDALVADIEAFNTVSVWWDVLDAAGNRFCFSLPAVKADSGDPSGGSAGSFIEIPDVVFSGHDPSKDPTSAYYSDAFGYQFGIYTVAA